MQIILKSINEPVKVLRVSHSLGRGDLAILVISADGCKFWVSESDLAIRPNIIPISFNVGQPSNVAIHQNI